MFLLVLIVVSAVASVFYLFENGNVTAGTAILVTLLVLSALSIGIICIVANCVAFQTTRDAPRKNQEQLPEEKEKEEEEEEFS